MRLRDLQGSRLRSAYTSTRATNAPEPPAGLDFYGPAVVGATTIGARATDPALVDAVVDEVAQLDPDAYVEHVQRFVRDGRARAGGAWQYADITTALAAAAQLLRPATYLEIGVRRGRSASVVARRVPDCSIVAVDFWNKGYAGIDNPGPDHVREVLRSAGHRGELNIVSGDSHVELPRLFAREPEISFDLVTVDGDHSSSGARRDLLDVLPRVRIGGALVFDDISHPAHPELDAMWQRTVASDRRFATWQFDDVGYGVAVAVRRW
ncbi:MAG: class I SAM-dependent methyltransferase [Gaiellaceae bacterium]